MIAYSASRISFRFFFSGAICSWFREALLNPDTDISAMGEINPATGLPMENGLDVSGNAYGAGEE